MAEYEVKLYSYDEDIEPIVNYLERFNPYADLQEVPPNKRQRILLTSLSLEVYTTLKELVRPEEITKVSFSRLSELLL